MRERRTARVDLTTGFGDRIALEDAARTIVPAAVKKCQPLAVVVVRLVDAADVFVRDESISLALRASLRDSDRPFRLDADTIVLLLLGTKGANVWKVMHRVSRLTDRPFSYTIAEAPTQGADLYELIEAADLGAQHCSF